MFTDEIKALLLADGPTSTAASGGIYDMVMPRGNPNQTIVYSVVHAPQEYTMSGQSQTSDITMQFDVYADSAAQGRAIHNVVKKVLSGFKGILDGGSYVQGAFWGLDMDKRWEPAINKTATGFALMFQVNFVYIPASS